MRMTMRSNPFVDDDWERSEKERRRNNAQIRKQNKQFERLQKRKSTKHLRGKAKPSLAVKVFMAILDYSARREAAREAAREERELRRILEYIENGYQESFEDKFIRFFADLKGGNRYE